MMRILMLAQFYPPVIGGEERHVYSLGTELAARGHEVAIATLWQKGTTAFEQDEGVRVYRIHGSMQRASFLFSEKERRHAPPFPDPEVLWTLRRIIAQERPDIVHAHNWMVHSFTPLKAWSRAKLIVTLHDTSLICAKKRFMYQGAICNGPVLQKCFTCTIDHYGTAKGISTTVANSIWSQVERRNVDMFLAVSQAIAEATHLASEKTPYRIIPNFIPNVLNMSHSDTAQLLAQLPTGDFWLFIGDLIPDKGIEVLLRAYAEMTDRIPLVLIGRPGATFPSTLPAGVSILKSWPHAVLMHALSRCTASIIPSIVLDACPTVAIEAMAMGKPVIASHIGGLSDIVVDGETGLLIPPGDWHSLREAMQRLLHDSELRERMAVRAKQRVKEFQAQTVVSRIEQVYQEVLYS